MTMKLTIKNEDASRTAVVKTIDLKLVQDPANPGGMHVPDPDQPGTVASTAEIAPGATAEFWIHNGRKIDVTEKP
jgi:hypothetical protein